MEYGRRSVTRSGIGGRAAGRAGTARANRVLLTRREIGLGPPAQWSWPDGWDLLLPGANISFGTGPGDHFGIMRGEGIVNWGSEIGKALA